MTRLLDVLGKHYGLDRDQLSPIEGGYQNQVFEMKREDGTYILRLTDSHLRSLEEVYGELAFIDQAKAFGLGVAGYIVLKGQDPVSLIRLEDKTYYGVVFDKAPGQGMTYGEYLNNPKMFYDLGRLVGGLHQASRSLDLGEISRPTFEDNSYLRTYKSYLPDQDKALRIAFEKHIRKIKGLQFSPEDWGLIHGDLNIGNFFLDGDHMTLFDFDECQVSAYIEDIAICLFYTVYMYNDDDLEARIAQGQLFMEHFLKGYTQVSDLNKALLAYIPDYLRLREMIVLVGIYKKWDMNQLTQWQGEYLKSSKRRLREGIPLLDQVTSWMEYIK